MTKRTHASGTDRINEVAELEYWEEDQIIVNLQGDSPLMPVENINQVAKLLSDSPDAGIATLATKILDPKELEDPNVVKVEFGESGQATSFDRKVESKSNQIYWRHLGIYSYRVGTLKYFSQHERTKEEAAVRLEQLRAFDLNMEIVIQEANIVPGPEVDTESDLNVVRAIMANN
jgi:3-deoxy-manno-octulosonate cytidylyltransferase (CMP-KDO synthetase)